MSAAPTLFLPRQYATGRTTVPKPPAPKSRPSKPFWGPETYVGQLIDNVRRGRKASPWKGAGPDPIAHPGRGYGEPVGVWIDGLVARRKVIVLCDGCMSKFYYKRVHYYRDERFRNTCTAECDGCRDYTSRGRIFMPEERLIEKPGGEPGQCWIPT